MRWKNVNNNNNNKHPAAVITRAGRRKFLTDPWVQSTHTRLINRDASECVRGSKTKTWLETCVARFSRAMFQTNVDSLYKHVSKLRTKHGTWSQSENGSKACLSFVIQENFEKSVNIQFLIWCYQSYHHPQYLTMNRKIQLQCAYYRK